MDNTTINAEGETLDEALGVYRKSIQKSDDVEASPTSGLPDYINVTGIVERMGLTTSDNQTVYFMLTGIGKVFQYAFSYTYPEAMFLQIGDEVSIAYYDTEETVVSVDTLDIKDVVLEPVSSTQAQKNENDQMVQEEMDRIDGQ